MIPIQKEYLVIIIIELERLIIHFLTLANFDTIKLLFERL